MRGRPVGYKMSDESKEKIRLAKLGKAAWNKGIKGTGFALTPENRDISGKGNRGKKCPWVKAPRMFKEANPNWKGGITLEQKAFRDSIEYKQWRLAVFIRDSFTCQTCLDSKTKMHAHHIKLFSKYPELRLDVNNGLTLCKPCHRLIHTTQAT